MGIDKAGWENIFNELNSSCTTGTVISNPRSTRMMNNMRHYVASSSAAVCKIGAQPNNVEDVAKIMNILKKYKAPFAIKGGGHATNPNFSSTEGLQIDMSSFSSIKYSAENHFVDVGAGCLWDGLYAHLAITNENVVGGASSNGVGVAGYLLGGGYSLKTNQYGLGIDNILEMDVVLPNGDIKTVDAGSRLFKALKGGGNNFGIVTRFRLKTHSQGKTWGAAFEFEENYENDVKSAIDNFIRTEDRPQAALVAAFRHSVDYHGNVKHHMSVLCVYDGAKPDRDPWGQFAAINAAQGQRLRGDPANWRRYKDGIEYLLNDLRERICYKEVNAMAAERHNPWSELTAKGERGRFGCIMVEKFNRALIDAVASESKKAAENMKVHDGVLVVLDVWPFLPSAFTKSTPAAWPHQTNKSFGPLLAYFLWNNENNDAFWLGRMQTALNNLQQVALREGCASENLPVYSNTCLETVNAEQIYGGQYEELRRFRAHWDPDNVMGNTGGFKIPFPAAPDAEEWVDSDADDDNLDEEDPLWQLRKYDTVFVVDDSWSMRHERRWADAQKALEEIAEVAEKYDANGVDIYFLNNDTCGQGYKTAQEVRSLIQTVTPDGDTPLGARLEQILLDYMQRIEDTRESNRRRRLAPMTAIKPMDIIIITDGIPTDNPERVIIRFAERLTKGNWPETQIGLQFVQVGNNKKARKYLLGLDDKVEQNHLPDFVCTIPYAGQTFNKDLLVKVLLGAINSRIRDKVDQLERSGR